MYQITKFGSGFFSLLINSAHVDLGWLMANTDILTFNEAFLTMSQYMKTETESDVTDHHHH